MYGYRQLKDLFKKNKWTVLIVVWSTAIIYLHVQHFTHLSVQSIPINRKLSNNVSVSQIPVYNVKYYDVLLNSYMRSGSTLTGIMLGWRDDTFYLYEPLWKISRWSYWHGNNTVCRSDRPECRIIEPEKPINDQTFSGNKEYLRGSLVIAQKILRKFYDCQFNDFDRVVLDTKVTVKLGGPSWKQVRTCIDGKQSPKLCMHRFAPRNCKNATHRVTKVLRLTTDLLGDLLRSKTDLKVIHLFRDPRAIINSRIETYWYPTKTQNAIIDNAKALCKKMLTDFVEGKKLLKMYPDRFKFIYYEDMNDDLYGKVKLLYQYLGMSLDEKHIPKEIRQPQLGTSNKTSDRRTNTAYWWRMSLQWDIVQKMDTVCADVYKELGYKTFRNVEEYKDMSFKSVEIPEEYIIQS